ncbi:MAG: hypothetical protein AB1555_15515 [Nitrospirota bacterium]
MVDKLAGDQQQRMVDGVGKSAIDASIPFFSGRIVDLCIGVRTARIVLGVAGSRIHAILDKYEIDDFVLGMELLVQVRPDAINLFLLGSEASGIVRVSGGVVLAQEGTV